MSLTNSKIDDLGVKLKKVVPEWVFEDQNGYKMFQPEGFEGMIVEAIKGSHSFYGD